LEVGKNRMEALGEVQETADFFNLYADDYAGHNGFDNPLPDDPLPDFRSHNRSVMKPYGVWVVIAPYNFPFALAGGPVAAALITGNTVVLKTATDTPWSGRLLADCIRDAGLPRGVFNYLNGGGSVVGEALLNHPNTAGITFTGSVDVGMHIYRTMANGVYPRPCIAEMGGKNACIVTANADLDRAADGIVRSAFGLSGQKCSAVSRIYVDDKVADPLIKKLQKNISAIRIGDPSRQENWLGPVTTANALQNYERYTKQLAENGARILSGGKRLTEGDLAHGYFVAPTLAEAPATHPLFKEEMFVPITMVCRVRDRAEAIRLANDSRFGLTAGLYGNDDDAAYFFDNIEAGVTYVNRPQGATTGAWPGYQPFGGWKGSGSSGKGIASFYYLAQYQREQSQTAATVQRDVAEAHAEEDRRFRELVDTRNKADSLIHAVEKSLRNLGDKVDAAERARVESAVSDLRTALKGDDRNVIEKKAEALAQASSAIALVPVMSERKPPRNMTPGEAPARR